MPEQGRRGEPSGIAPILVMMGVSGCGKTTVGVLIARARGWRFQEGDELHPRANIEKMRNGIPLDDADRMPWLHAVAAVIDAWIAQGSAGIITCSALKRSYRRIIVGSRPGVFLVYLKGSQRLIAERLATRHGHFMPASLLASQFAALEEPTAEEGPIVADIGAPPERIAAAILAALAERLHPSRRGGRDSASA